MDFNCREIVYSIFRYSRTEFLNLDIAKELLTWKEEFEANSSASPVLLGSPFDDDAGNLGLDLDIEEDIDPDTAYVIIYYFYENAEYRVSDEVGEGWSVRCNSILAGLDIECAMESVTDGTSTEYFECISSSDKSELMLAIFTGTEVLVQGEAEELFSPQEKNTGNMASIHLKFMYKNSDTDETVEDNLSLEVKEVKASELIRQLIENPEQEKLVEFFRHLFGNPDFDGSDNLGVKYQELFTTLSTKAWRKLGWNEVTIDILEISVEGQLNINLYSDGFDLSQLSLQLAHDDNGGFMYLYA